jgi:hypothetical protein
MTVTRRVRAVCRWVSSQKEKRVEVIKDLPHLRPFLAEYLDSVSANLQRILGAKAPNVSKAHYYIHLGAFVIFTYVTLIQLTQ